MSYYEDIKLVCRHSSHAVLSKSDVWHLLVQLNPRYEDKRNSVIPADYCYNCINHGIMFDKHIFIRTGETSYEFVDEDYDYEGDVFYAPGGHWASKRAVGQWKGKRFEFWERFRKLPDKYVVGNQGNNTVDQGACESASHAIDKHTYQKILSRRGQADFRRKLLHAYENKCAITGCSTTAVLEAAHILPHSEMQSYATKHGILLRADIHTLFDLYLMSVDPSTMQLVVSKECMDDYGQLIGKQITVPAHPNERPSVDALATHHGAWLEMNDG